MHDFPRNFSKTVNVIVKKQLNNNISHGLFSYQWQMLKTQMERLVVSLPCLEEYRSRKIVVDFFNVHCIYGYS